MVMGTVRAATTRCILALAISLSTGYVVHAQGTPAQQIAAAFKAGEEARIQNRMGVAIEQFEKARKLLLEHFPKETKNIAAITSRLAEIYLNQNRFDLAEPLCKECLTAFQKVGDRFSHAVVQSYVGRIQFSRGEFDRALETYRTCLIAFQELQADTRTKGWQARMHARIADVHVARRDYSRAEAAFLESLSRSDADGPGFLGDANRTKIDLAKLYTTLGQYDQAISRFKESLAYWNKASSAGPNVALIQNDWGEMLWQRAQHSSDPAADYAEAEERLRESLRLREGLLAANDPDLAATLNNMGLLCHSRGLYDEALGHFERALRIFEARNATDSTVAAVRVNLASLHRSRSDYEKAEEHYQKARSLFLNQKENGRADLAGCLNCLAVLCRDKKDTAKSLQFMDQALRLSRGDVAAKLTAEPESWQLISLRDQHEPWFHTALSLAMQQINSPNVADMAAAWVLNGKAVTLEVLSQRELGMRDDPSDLRREYQKIRVRLAALPPGASKAERDALGAKEEEFARQIIRRLTEARATLTSDPWIELQQVRSKIPEKSVLIEITKFRQADFRSKGTELAVRGNPRYVAWIIPSGRDTDGIRVVDLGDAKPLEDAVEVARQAMLASATRGTTQGTIQAKGGQLSEQELQTPLRALAQKMLHPLLPHIGQKEHWIVSPDGSLWLTPWETLPLPNNKYAIEEHTVSYLVSGRDLVAGPARGKPSDMGSPLILADPDYNAGVPAKQQGRTFGELALTGAEADNIKQALEAYSRSNPRVLMREKATKQAFFEQARSPRILVLSTHGFFQAEMADRVHNPLLTCGLALAGANGWPDKHDGVLSGLEIVGTDLRGTELVVLSACETGLGKVRDGEAVASLRQAFHLAGAESVVASLWEVPEAQTAELMRTFFVQFAKGRGKADSLREAQLAFIKASRENDGHAHPFLWAAFTLTGQK